MTQQTTIDARSHRRRPAKHAFKPRPCVYALCDPLTGEVRYIGSTRDLKNRFKAHIAPTNLTGSGFERGSGTYKCRWVAGLLRRGLLPSVRVLEFVGSRNLFTAEERWVAAYLLAGARLCNWCLTKGKLPIDYQI